MVNALSHYHFHIFVGIIDRGYIDVLADDSERFIVASAAEDLCRHFGRLLGQAVSALSALADNAFNVLAAIPTRLKMLPSSPISGQLGFCCLLSLLIVIPPRFYFKPITAW